MATAAQTLADPAVSTPGSGYHCPCGHVLRVFGGGRHRVYLEPRSGQRDEPVMNRACPACGRELPGKGRPYAPTAAAALVAPTAG